MPALNEAEEWFALRAVSLAARGLLCDLAYLWRRLPRRMGRATVCQMTGIAEAEFDCLAEELKSVSVIHFDEAGFVRYPRLEAETRRRELGRESGKKGGNPALIARQPKTLIR